MAKKPLSEEQREKLRAYKRQWDREHREMRLEQQRTRYWANPEKARAVINKRSKKRYWADPEKGRKKSRVASKTLYWADPEKAREKARARYWAAKGKK
jgi:hypothetical protein